MRSIALLREFARDFVRPEAAQKPTSLIVDTPASALIAVATVGSYLNTTRDLIVDALGIQGAFLPAIIAVAAFVACIFAISSKQAVDVPVGLSTRPAHIRQYSFGTWTRRFAKIAFVALALIIPKNVVASLEESLPLPSALTGMILDAQTRKPAEGAKVRIVTSDGVDVTSGDDGAETDSQGVFVVDAKQRVWRSAALIVYRLGCKPTTVALWKRFQTSVPSFLTYVDASTSPFFIFYTECEK